ncbi:hypothetical protein CLOM_g11, partial [Closterium sp. NIES-68]
LPPSFRSPAGSAAGSAAGSPVGSPAGSPGTASPVTGSPGRIKRVSYAVVDSNSDGAKREGVTPSEGRVTRRSHQLAGDRADTDKNAIGNGIPSWLPSSGVKQAERDLWGAPRGGSRGGGGGAGGSSGGSGGMPFAFSRSPRGSPLGPANKLKSYTSLDPPGALKSRGGKDGLDWLEEIKKGGGGGGGGSGGDSSSGGGSWGGEGRANGSETGGGSRRGVSASASGGALGGAGGFGGIGGGGGGGGSGGTGAGVRGASAHGIGGAGLPSPARPRSSPLGRKLVSHSSLDPSFKAERGGGEGGCAEGGIAEGDGGRGSWRQLVEQLKEGMEVSDSDQSDSSGRGAGARGGGAAGDQSNAAAAAGAAGGSGAGVAVAVASARPKPRHRRGASLHSLPSLASAISETPFTSLQQPAAKGAARNGDDLSPYGSTAGVIGIGRVSGGGGGGGGGAPAGAAAPKPRHRRGSSLHSFSPLGLTSSEAIFDSIQRAAEKEAEHTGELHAPAYDRPASASQLSGQLHGQFDGYWGSEDTDIGSFKATEEGPKGRLHRPYQGSADISELLGSRISRGRERSKPRAEERTAGREVGRRERTGERRGEGKGKKEELVRGEQEQKVQQQQQQQQQQKEERHKSPRDSLGIRGILHAASSRLRSLLPDTTSPTGGSSAPTTAPPSTAPSSSIQGGSSSSSSSRRAASQEAPAALASFSLKSADAAAGYTDREGRPTGEVAGRVGGLRGRFRRQKQGGEEEGEEGEGGMDSQGGSPVGTGGGGDGAGGGSPGGVAGVKGKYHMRRRQRSADEIPRIPKSMLVTPPVSPPNQSVYGGGSAAGAAGAGGGKGEGGGSAGGAGSSGAAAAAAAAAAVSAAALHQRLAHRDRAARGGAGGGGFRGKAGISGVIAPRGDTVGSGSEGKGGAAPGRIILSDYDVASIPHEKLAELLGHRQEGGHRPDGGGRGAGGVAGTVGASKGRRGEEVKEEHGAKGKGQVKGQVNSREREIGSSSSSSGGGNGDSSGRGGGGGGVVPSSSSVDSSSSGIGPNKPSQRQLQQQLLQSSLALQTQLMKQKKGPLGSVLMLEKVSTHSELDKKKKAAGAGKKQQADSIIAQLANQGSGGVGTGSGRKGGGVGAGGGGERAGVRVDAASGAGTGASASGAAGAGGGAAASAASGARSSGFSAMRQYGSIRPSDYVLKKPYKDLATRYVLHQDELGSGEYGVIRKCLEIATGQVLACKTIKKSRIKTQEAADDIRMEVASMLILKGHPYIVTLHDAVEDAKYVHLVMEFCRGGDLFDRITKGGVYSEPLGAHLCLAITEALLHCHRHGVIHRDIKPENIMLLEPGSDTRIKVLDFGVATFFQEGVLLHDVIGTPEYMAPEVWDGCYGPAVDVWSTGVVMYIAMSGVPPFWAASKQSVQEAVATREASFKSAKWAHISDECKHLIGRMLAKNPRERITCLQILGHPWIRRHSSR